MPPKISLTKENKKPTQNEFVTSVHNSLKTPVTKLKYCYLAKPFFYPGSHIGRYSITLLFDLSNKDHAAFLKTLEGIATKEGVEHLGYIDNGDVSLKFQTKDKPDLFALPKGKKKAKKIDLEHDVPEGFEASVEFQLNTYFNKSTQKKAFNLCPKTITFHLEDDIEQESTETKKDGNNKNRRGRPRTKNDGVCDSKLQSGKKRNLGKQLRSTKNPRQAKGK